MKVVLSFILFFLIATGIKAQVASTSLYITLSDIQSVQIVDDPIHSKPAFSEKKSAKRNISILNPGASQIRKYESQTGEIKSASQQRERFDQTESHELIFNDSKTAVQLANLDSKIDKKIPLIVYQIDPR